MGDPDEREDAPDAGVAPDPAAPEGGTASPSRDRPREIGGRDGPEPTRFGDWERNGRCVDF